jgi:uridylate kinase
MKTFNRILLKISGETLLAKQNFGICQKACLALAHTIRDIHKAGIQLGIVIGAGNIFRGIHLSEMGLSRTPADHMGMLGTLFNGIALQQALHSLQVPVSIMSALECPQVVETYNWEKSLQHLKNGTIVIFVGGTGNPYFTTDTAAALRASEIQADVLMKATKVEGIYDKDPFQYKNACKYETISYTQILNEKLQVMDATAIILCRSNRIPIFVFNMYRFASEPIENIFSQLHKGTWVTE